MSLFVDKTHRLNPIWTIKTSSLFILNVSARELFNSLGLHCLVKDFDKLGSSEKLGEIVVSPQTLYEANGERLEYKLRPPPGSKETIVPGYLAIRCRRATDHDKKFMAEFAKQRKDEARKMPHPIADTGLGLKNAIKEAQLVQGGASNFKSLVTKRSRIAKNGQKEVRTLRRQTCASQLYKMGRSNHPFLA